MESAGRRHNTAPAANASAPQPTHVSRDLMSHSPRRVDPLHPRSGRRIAVVLVLLAGIGWYVYPKTSDDSRRAGPATPPTSNTRNESLPPEGVTPADYRQAKLDFFAAQGRSPDHIETLVAVGQRARTEQRFESALSAALAVPATEPRYGAFARLQAAICLTELDRAADAERQFLSLLPDAADEAIVPPNIRDEARDWLRYLYSIELRFEDRRRVLAEIHQHGLPRVSDSTEYIFPSLLIWNSDRGRERLRRFLQRTPDDPRLLVAEGRHLTGEGRVADARRLLEELHRRQPDNLPVLAALLEACFETADWNAFEMHLPTTVAPDEPWLLSQMRGEAALQRQDWNAAVEHFSRLLAVDATHAPAVMGLSRAFTQLGRTDEADMQRQRASILARIRPRLPAVTEEDPAAVDEIAVNLAELGLPHAAAIFRDHAVRIRARPRPAAQDSPQGNGR